MKANAKKSNGVHYTPNSLAERLAKTMLSYAVVGDAPLRVVDPAVGDGELLYALANAAISKGVGVSLAGSDIDENAVLLAQARLETLVPAGHTNIAVSDFLEKVDKPAPKTLFSISDDPWTADLMIANPPYVRTQVLGAAKVQRLTEKFDLTGRVDIYQAFIKAISWSLIPGGITGIIIPNRFMTVRGGAEIRAFLLKNFDVLEVWDLGDTRVFEAAVLPAILILQKKSHSTRLVKTLFKSVYRTIDPQENLRVVENVCDALDAPGTVRTRSGDTLKVLNGGLDHGNSDEGVWRISTESNEDWLDTVAKHTFCTFRDVGKVRVGVKSTADNVFLRKSWQDIREPELLRPVTTHHVARSYRAHPISRQILYPHAVIDGKRVVVDLEQYPISKRYLEDFRSQLEGRSYLMDSGREWYELWVPQSPQMWAMPKVVFRDISENPTFWLDMEGTVVNGDCYWIVSENGDENELWLLLAVANSRFIEDFYDHRFNNKLYAGRRRFMTQYVEKFPLPDPRLSSSRGLIARVKRIYQGLEAGEDMSHERALIEAEVYACFGIRRPESSVFSAMESEAFDSEPFPQTA